MLGIGGGGFFAYPCSPASVEVFVVCRAVGCVASCRKSVVLFKPCVFVDSRFGGIRSLLGAYDSPDKVFGGGGIFVERRLVYKHGGLWCLRRRATSPGG